MLNESWVLSTEQAVQCDKTSNGCDGGMTDNVYNYVANVSKGIETESAYPYTSYSGTTGSCHYESSKVVVTVDNYTRISGESNMAAYVQSTGPLSVCIDATTWNTYSSGVLKSCGRSVNHCVQAVGVDASSTSSGYWKLRNSWGDKW
jgi:C1A family cysteine protease